MDPASSRGLRLFGLLLLVAFAVTAFGVMVSIRIRRFQTFTAVMQMLVLPLFFLSGALFPVAVSGALFPVAGLPTWLEVLNRLNPLTYAVDPRRRLVLDHVEVADAARRTLDAGVTWFGWRVPTLLELAVVLALGVAAMAVAIAQFSRIE